MKNLLLALGFLSLTSCIQESKSYTPEEQPVNLSLEESIRRGEYLVTIMDCHACHSPKIMTPQGPVPDPNRLLSGFDASQPLEELSKEEKITSKKWVLFHPQMTSAIGPWGTTFAANISSDDTGIGTWSYEQFKKALTEGRYKGLVNTRPLLPPMPWQTYQDLEDKDVRAIYDYLKTTTPIENIVPAPQLAMQPQ
ncbi:hypothetical protein [Salinimicrobium xinjiangense]|uniref:hypothetical protein n=1 Tax=Salinimicrobium xinjiangense TaxID=438596 RepID=UPI00042A6376|nr:hypothetical protein [Salinimicrobium xinjiangense]